MTLPQGWHQFQQKKNVFIWKYYETDILKCQSVLSEHEKELVETNDEN